MGVYYHYINHTKKEYFSIGAFGGGLKFWNIGRNPAARAFELMLVQPNAATKAGKYKICGRWHGDQVSIEGDDYNSEWELIEREFTDIGADLIILLIEVDGFASIGSLAAENEELFMELCHLASTRQAPELEKELKDVFGEDYMRQYAELCQKNQWFVPQDLAKNDV